MDVKIGLLHQRSNIGALPHKSDMPLGARSLDVRDDPRAVRPVADQQQIDTAAFCRQVHHRIDQQGLVLLRSQAPDIEQHRSGGSPLETRSTGGGTGGRDNPVTYDRQRLRGQAARGIGLCHRIAYRNCRCD